jgi:hypothetical protein
MATPRVNVVSRPKASIELIPEFLANGCTRPLRGSNCQNTKLELTIRPAPVIAIISEIPSIQI